MKEIVLSRGMVALVDDEDFEDLNRWKWTFNTGYATRQTLKRDGPRRSISMHRQIMNAPSNMQVDHINMNRLDNRRCNLRLATRSQNNANRRKPTGMYTSKFKGVSWSRWKNCWRAEIKLNGRKLLLGQFEDEVEASETYKRAARELFGEYARLD